MKLEEEVKHFDDQCALLDGFISELATLNPDDQNQRHFFLAEAVTFRLYRVYERLVRATFLNYCVQTVTLNGSAVNSKLRCLDWVTAESILKSGNKFLDWGSVVSVKKMSALVFENGFPVSDFLSPRHSDLVDLQRFRNFVAHDSSEAEDGFKKARGQYVRVGDPEPVSVGELALYRKSLRADMTLRLLHSRISGLSGILTSL